MLRRTVLAMLGSVALLAAQAAAQPGLSTKPDMDAIDRSDKIAEAARLEAGRLRERSIDALNQKDYATAEPMLKQLVAHKPSTNDAHFLLGLAEVGLGKSAEAAAALEAATKDEPNRPEPKTRLGLVYVDLKRSDDAKKQLAELARLDSACKTTCADAKWIADGVYLINHALTTGQGSASLDAVVLSSASALADANASVGTAPQEFDPKKYGLVTFEDTHELYELLTQEGRCPPKKLAEPRQPCALILYVPTGDSGNRFAFNFKPVFEVFSQTEILSIHNKALRRVKVEELYFDDDLVVGANTGGKKSASYRSYALIGNDENKARCAQGLPCLSNFTEKDMFQMYGNMPDSVVDAIWSRKMTDPGAKKLQRDF